MKNFKTKVINVICIILILFAGLIMHELMYALAKYLIPYPVTLGMIGGFTLGFLYHKKP
jgi:Na+/glutamate symporter